MGWREANAELNDRIYRIKMRGLVMKLRAEQKELEEREFRSWLMWERYMMDVRLAELRAFKEEDHPRKPAGTSGGGQFVSKSGSQGLTDEQIRDTIEKALKEKGLIKQSNTVSYPPKPINTDDLVFDSKHANKKHDVTEEQAKEYIRAAIISIARKFPGQPQEFENYFSENGAAFVDIVTKHITTAFPSEDFNQTVQDIVSEAMKHVK